jgi:hypothetical protein
MWLERRILAQDRLVEVAQRAAGLDSELLDEDRPRFLIRLERLRLPPGTVEGEHQLSAEALAVWVLAHERLELADERRVAAGGEIGVDPVLEARQAELVEPGALRLGETSLRDIGERAAAPERKRRGGLAGCDERLEALEVELARVDAKPVTGRLRLQAVLAQQLAQLGHVDLQRLRRRLGRLVVPERVDQTVRGDGPVPLQEERGEQRPLLRAAQLERAAVVEDLERAQDAEFHGWLPATLTPKGAGGQGTRR